MQNFADPGTSEPLFKGKRWLAVFTLLIGTINAHAVYSGMWKFGFLSDKLRTGAAILIFSVVVGLALTYMLGVILRKSSDWIDDQTSYYSENYNLNPISLSLAACLALPGNITFFTMWPMQIYTYAILGACFGLFLLPIKFAADSSKYKLFSLALLSLALLNALTIFRYIDILNFPGAILKFFGSLLSSADYELFPLVRRLQIEEIVPVFFVVILGVVVFPLSALVAFRRSYQSKDD